jgi:Ca2+-binding EF-hand superfamily protein
MLVRVLYTEIMVPGVFSLFSTQQVQQFKEAFSLIDQDADGIVDEADLKNMFGSLGKYFTLN